MRILKLDLRAFGPFTDVELDVSAGREGLHLSYGHNEAGKSSALRAVEQMLFGVPPRSSDDFIHPYSNLRVGGTLEGRSAGSPLAFLRRKGNKATLLEADNRTVLDETALGDCLGGLDRDLFATMFGIGHPQLVRGGQEIIRGQGEIGQLLFAAGSGIADLQKVRQRLEDHSDELFTRRGQVRQINQKLKALDEAKRALREAQLPAARWSEHDEALREAQARRKAVVAELQDWERQKRRWDRFRQAQPLIARRRNLRAQRASLGCVPILPDGFADQRRETETNLRIAAKEEHSAAEDLSRIGQELEALAIPADLLAAADRIDALSQTLGGYRKAQRDLPGLEARREQLNYDARALLGQLRPELDLALADQLRLTSPQRLEIQNLGNSAGALSRQLEQSRDRIAEARSLLADAEAELASLPADRDGRPLVAALRRIRGQGDLEQQRTEATAELQRLDEESHVELKRLGLWSGTLEELETLPLPTPETVDRYETELSEAEQRIGSLADRADEARSKRADVDRQIEEIRLGGDVPTEEDLLAARALREEGWQLVLEAWQQGSSDDARTGVFLANFSSETDLSAAYSQSVERTDELADRLRRESNRVAKRAALQATRDTLDQEIARYQEQIERATDARRQLFSAWRCCWQPARIEPSSPREMRAWLRRQQALTVKVQAIRGQRLAAGNLGDRIAACRNELDQCLAQLDEAPGGPEKTLAALVDRCEQIADRIAAVSEKRQTLGETVARMSKEVAAAEAAAAKADAELNHWRDRWAAAIEPLGLPPESEPAVANEVVARIGELFDRLKEAAGFAERIAQIARDSEAFCSEARDLAGQVAPDLSDTAVERVVETLVRRCQKAAEDRQQQQKLLRERNRYEEIRRAAHEKREQLAARLATMCREAGCAEPEELPQIERNSEAAARLDENLASLDDQLAVLAAGASSDQFTAEAEAVDPDDLPVRINDLSQIIERLQAERDELQRRVGQEENALASIDTGAQASEAGEAIQDLLAQIATDVDQYVRYRLAAVVLKEAVQRYQEQNEAPVLQLAGDYFRRLTVGSFVKLVADFSEQGEKVLMGDRGDGSNLVPLAGMSDGTCDQLYLSLRLAGLEHFLQSHEPVPFIVDDILIGFDDRRSAAALQILAELAGKTQVIFFTHHEHLLQLAETHLPAGEFFIHRLPGRPTVECA